MNGLLALPNVPAPDVPVGAESTLATLATDGSYFITADVSALGFRGTDMEFCRAITAQARVAAIPVSAFYVQDAPAHYVRFAFCKQPAILHEALGRLAAWLAAPKLTATG